MSSQASGAGTDVLAGFEALASSTGIALPPLLLYAGGILWTIGYDTIYALQDIEDDALIGVKSTARLFGENARQIVALFYAGAMLCWLGAALLSGAGLVFVLLLVAPAAVLAWQVQTLRPNDPKDARAKFYANHWVGVTFTLALLAEALRTLLTDPVAHAAAVERSRDRLSAYSWTDTASTLRHALERSALRGRR